MFCLRPRAGSFYFSPQRFLCGILPEPLCAKEKNLHTAGAFAYIRPWKLTVVNIEKPLFSTVSEIRNACELTQRHVNGGETNHPPESDPSPEPLQTIRLSLIFPAGGFYSSDRLP